MHKHAFVPFYIGEDELQIAEYALEQQIANIEPTERNSRIALDMKSPAVNSNIFTAATAGLAEGFASRALETANMLESVKLRCFICKGNASSHADENHREALDRLEREIIESRSPLRRSPQFQSKDLTKLANRRMEQFYEMRDISASIALKLH